MQHTNIVVVGSINMDLVTQSKRFPKVGETLLGEHFNYFPGGKGANQAVAASRLGANVKMIGSVGNDTFGKQLLTMLQNENINTAAIEISPQSPTGIANITVAEHDNHIIVVSGANWDLSPSDIIENEQSIADCDVVLCQLEIPMETVLATARMAHQYHKPFILNPAPAQRLSEELLKLTTIITPNQHELIISLGLNPDLPLTDLMKQSPCSVLVTQGKEGAVYKQRDDQTIKQVKSYPLTVVDTTGAGDTFNGALAVFWQLGLAEATQKANAAAALSITKMGAQSGMPTKDELSEFLEVQNNK